MSGTDDNVDGGQVAKLVDRRSDLRARGGRGKLPADRSRSRLEIRAQRARLDSQSRHASAASHREALTAIKDGHFVQALGILSNPIRRASGKPMTASG